MCFGQPSYLYRLSLVFLERDDAHIDWYRDQPGFIMNPNPYSAPLSDLNNHSSAIEDTALWNPAAAAWWSLLFTPIFGAIIQMKNWEALGQHKKARASKTWAITLVVVQVVITTWSALAPEESAIHGFTNLLAFMMLVSWYIASGREQVGWLKYAGYYEKRGWGMPFLIGVLALLGVVTCVVIVTMFKSSNG